MTDEATEEIDIAAPPARCYEIALDFESYPAWAADIKEVEVLERDDKGRGTKVRFRAAAMGQSIRYTLAYDHSQAPEVLAWRQVGGDMTRKLDGSYVFEPSPTGTRMVYNLEVDLRVPLLGFIKRRAEHRILATALRELKARAEAS